MAKTLRPSEPSSPRVQRELPSVESSSPKPWRLYASPGEVVNARMGALEQKVDNVFGCIFEVWQVVNDSLACMPRDAWLGSS